MRGEPTDDAHPLWRWRTIDLVFEHSQCIRERANPVPAQFQVVVQPTSDDVHVTIDQSWDRAMPFKIDALCGGRGGSHDKCFSPDPVETARAGLNNACLLVL